RSRGLSVLLRVTSIFTRNAISPSSWLRQQRSRYAIRAGRNLPDKEFRYLRMVIVTTAVYWGLNSPLHRTNPVNGSSYPSSTGQASVRIHRLTSSHGPVFLINSRFSLASATTTSTSPSQLGSPGWSPFSRSYGGILPSSLTTILSITCVFSTRPPVSVIGYGQHTPSRRCFSRQQRITRSPHRQWGAHQLSHLLWGRICLPPRATTLDRDNHRTAWLPFCVTPHAYRLHTQVPPRTPNQASEDAQGVWDG